MNRRLTLAQLARGAAVLAWGNLFSAAAAPARATTTLPPRGAYPFTLGVASGMPRPDSVVLWTRLAPHPHAPLGGLPDAPINVRWEAALDDNFSRVLRAGTFTALPAHAHSVHVQVTGLPSSTVLFYRFMVGDAVSPVGRTRTAPAAGSDVARLRIAVASCQHYEQGAFAAHRDIAEQDLDAVLFLGDYIYESSNPRLRVRSHEGPPPTTLRAYRARHATYKLDADLRAAHAAHPWLLTWDDHEVENDYANDQSPSGTSTAEFLARRSAAYKAYFEHMPVAPTMLPQGASMPIHDCFSWGRLAQLWTIDTRQFRDVQACNEPGRGGGRVVGDCSELALESRSLLGTAQEQWLAQGLARSECRWKLLGQASQVCPGGVDSPFGRRIFSDGWDGYPRARERLMQSIAQAQGGNVVCLSGDVHRHMAAQLRAHGRERQSAIVAGEFVCSSVTSHGVSDTLMALMRASNPDIVHGRSDERGYALIDVTPAAASCEFRATSSPAKAQARLATQARFVVENGRPGIATA